MDYRLADVRNRSQMTSMGRSGTEWPLQMKNLWWKEKSLKISYFGGLRLWTTIEQTSFVMVTRSKLALEKNYDTNFILLIFARLIFKLRNIKTSKTWNFVKVNGSNPIIKN